VKEELTGLIAATFTPMGLDGELNLAMVDKLAGLLIADGVSGAFVCGSTGESLSLTAGERMATAERWREAAGKDLAVIVHVGHNCLAECKALAAHAQKIGADAIGAMPPCFFRPETVQDLTAFCAEVAAAAPELPFYYYHIPSRTGVNLKMAEFLAIAEGKIPNLAGIKFTHMDLEDFGRCLDLAAERLTILFGMDQALLSALALGARGAIGTTYSFAGPLYRRLIEAFEAGDMPRAQAMQQRSRQMIALCYRNGGLGACKAVMKMIGLDCGPVRLPLRNPSDQQLEALAEGLAAMGFLKDRT